MSEILTAISASFDALSSPVWKDIVNSLVTAFGVLSFLYGLYERRQKRTLRDLIRANNWFMYQRINNANGHVQLALKTYKSSHATNADPEVIECIARADAFSQEIFKEIVRQIQVFEPTFTKHDLECWRRDGKLTDEKVALFQQFIVSESSFVDRWLKRQQ